MSCSWDWHILVALDSTFILEMQSGNLSGEPQWEQPAAGAAVQHAIFWAANSVVSLTAAHEVATSVVSHSAAACNFFEQLPQRYAGLQQLAWFSLSTSVVSHTGSSQREPQSVVSRSAAACAGWCTLLRKHEADLSGGRHIFYTAFS